MQDKKSNFNPNTATKVTEHNLSPFLENEVCKHQIIRTFFAIALFLCIISGEVFAEVNFPPEPGDIVEVDGVNYISGQCQENGYTCDPLGTFTTYTAMGQGGFMVYYIPTNTPGLCLYSGGTYDRPDWVKMLYWCPYIGTTTDPPTWPPDQQLDTNKNLGDKPPSCP